MGGIINKKSHENLEIFKKMKKFVAFFRANPWLENSVKLRGIKDNGI